MAAVYRARCRGSKTPVALKVGLAGADACKADHACVRREGRLLAALRHPNIVRLLDAGEHAGLPFLATEWLPGGSLADRLVGRPPPHQVVVGWLEAISRAVYHAHCHRVVHLDLRPTNILFSRGGIPRLIDFGLALKLWGPTGKARGGDPRYMAPEQEGGVAGPAADIHGLGAVLYQALTGRPPFHGVPLQHRLRGRRVRVPRPTAIRPGLPPALDAICRRCLHNQPERRYPTAEALADELLVVPPYFLERRRPASPWPSRCCTRTPSDVQQLFR
jgi:serine/threonine-protein kinase